ncbi:hypothetical protein CO709_06685 [Burkholderia thailandensis]|nr:hypothetical protein CO709_06685 [Burkholderia thailandensis]
MPIAPGELRMTLGAIAALGAPACCAARRARSIAIRGAADWSGMRRRGDVFRVLGSFGGFE